MRLIKIQECNINQFDAVVIGAGFAGAVIARQMSDTANKKVLILEKRDHIGGNMFDGGKRLWCQCALVRAAFVPHELN